MRRRGVLSNLPKMALPTVSWVAVMRLLRKAPKNLPALGPALRADMSKKAMVGCRAAPQTGSLRYADDYLAHLKGQGRGQKRSKPSAMLPLIGACSSTPHTDSFRVHHVVNQEALQMMLSLDDADFDHEAFFESDETCSGIIRDGDRLMHDDLYPDDSGRASSSMLTCSSSLNALASRSLTSSDVCAAFSRSSVDSEGLYSTATSASFSHAPSSLEPLNFGPYSSYNFRSPSSPIISSCGASERIDNYANSYQDLKLESRDEAKAEEAGTHDAEGADACLDLYAQNGQNNVQDDICPASTSCRAFYNQFAEFTVHAAVPSSAGGKLHVIDDDDAELQKSYEGDADDDDEGEIVAEMRYSEDPLEDFVEAISRMVVTQQLNKAAQLQELYWRFLRLNAPNHHETITLAFLRSLQRLAAFEPHHLRTLL